MSEERAKWNGTRFRKDDAGGHYESWFQRANDPAAPRAFWIRYTIFSPKGRPADAIGELWAVYFDGTRQRIVAVKEEHPIAQCSFAPDRLEARIREATLDAGGLEGRAARGTHSIRWSLRYGTDAPPLLLLSERLYTAPLPRAKALVGSPLARYQGSIEVDGERIAIDGWLGSQNHNWGSRHTDRYAWGQVAGFDGDDEAFLEVSTARLRIGPFMTPPLTPLVLRVDGEEHRLGAIGRALRARGRYEPFHWSFETRGETGGEPVEIRGTLVAPAWSFVALPYSNPPGGTKTCLNSKLGRCDLEVRHRGRTLTLRAENRAAFEILTDDPPPAGVSLL